MSGIPAAITSSLVSAILNWLSGKIQSLLSLFKQRSNAVNNAQQSVDPLKKAVTGDDIEKATKGALDGF